MRAGMILIVSICLLAPPTARADDRPDLVPELPQVVDETQVASEYMDAYTVPGKLLYRFDATLRNRGGTLDLFRDPNTGHAMQAVWKGGEPSEAPDPNVAPSGPDATIFDRSASGARFEYVFDRGHDHWHYFSAARYELAVPGEGIRVSDKIGFCLVDGLGQPRYFPLWYTGSGPQTWCGFSHPEGTFTRMGLSPGLADRYRSQRHFQWIDVTGLAPAAYELRALANPNGEVLESERSNNIVAETRTIPGVRIADAAAETATGATVEVGLSAAVIAPEIPARAAADCEPSETADECYAHGSAAGPVRFSVNRRPAHGAVGLRRGDDGLRATAIYSPDPGWEGTDSFTVAGTDGRGLSGPAATVTVTTRAPQSPPVPPPAAPPGLAGVAPPAPPLVRDARLERRRGRWFAVLVLGATATVRGEARRAGSTVRRYRTRRLGRGRRAIALGRLRGRFVVRLLVIAPAGRRTVVLRRG